MSLGDHLEELRWRILIGLIGPTVVGLGMIFIAPKIVDIICQPLLYELARRGLPPTLIARDIGAGFNVYLRVCVLGGLIVGIPWMLWQLWMFISPGLHPHERKFVLLLLPGSTVLAAAGVLFMYFVILPLSVWFFLGMTQVYEPFQLHPTWVQKYLIEEPKQQDTPALPGAPLQLPLLDKDPEHPANGQAWINTQDRMLKVMMGDQVMTVRFMPPAIVDPMIELDEHISYVLWLGLSFAVVFQLPLVMLLGGWIGLIDRKTLSKARKYVILAAFIIGAAITPGGSIIAQTLTALPMYLLYELGLLLMRLFVKRKTSLWSDWDDAGAE